MVTDQYYPLETAATIFCFLQYNRNKSLNLKNLCRLFNNEAVIFKSETHKIPTFHRRMRACHCYNLSLLGQQIV